MERNVVAIIQALDEQCISPNRSNLLFKGLYEQVITVVGQLRGFGINRNDRVAVALPNGPEAAVAFLAISSGATYAPLNPNYRAPEYEFYLKDLAAKALIVQPGVAAPAKDVAQQLGIPVIELLPRLDAAAGIFELSIPTSTVPETPDFAEPDDTALILHTSGTTSRPKMVPLSHCNLCISAQNVKTALALTETDRCLNVMPLFHIHGLIGALLSSMAAGASVVCTPGFYAPKFLGWLGNHQPTWYSAVPTMHQQILGRAATHTTPIKPLRLVRSSSAPLPPQIMAELEQVFNAPVIESYGMTEASHQMASNPLPPNQRKPGSVGVASGPDVQIMDEQGNLLPTGEVGEVVIQGDNVTHGYENNLNANATAFTNGWFRTGDLGYLDTDGYLFLKGRIKEIINRAGEKISPREVDEVLLDHPAIEQVVTFAAPHTLLGEDVAVAVVLKAGASVSEQTLKEFAAERLADFKVPRVVLFLDEIPKGPTGKRQRIGLAEKLGLTASDPTEDRPAYAAPQTPIEETLVDIWAEVLGISPIGVSDNFFQLGGDSILAAQIINRVRAELQVELSFLIFFQQPTIANIAIAITQLQAKTVDSDEMIKLLAELESLSDDDIQQLVK
ncbi:AMP-binding protein [Leptothoe kymatousa]|uniref:AMP-binding protein n=1 Tax=Leptothoe kymatousa TAU-MAC 1615 TaxID=2364775 RepID=A0ABS5Y569_9CYAN|nr:AMP-binding protein [Leptothoe kymatousa TAU-MAC 1615]